MNEDLLKLDRQVCFALSIASRSVLSVYRPLLEPLGLTHPQYLVMLALWEQSPRSAGELATVLRHEPATLTPLLRRLESAGYVTRRRDPNDERVLLIDLTETGRALRAQAEAIPPAVVERLGMPLAELEALRDALTRVIEHAAD